MSQLTGEQRYEIIFRYRIMKISIREIAEVMQINKNTVSN